MRVIVALTTAVLVVLLSLAPPVAAQSRQGEGGRGLGGVLDVLSDILGGSQKLTGHVVLARDDALVLRTSTGRSVKVNTSGIDSRIRTALQPGEPVTVTVKRGAEGAAPTATAIQLGGGDTKGAVTYGRTEGTVEKATASEILFKTRDGLVVPLDVSSMTGLEPLAPNQPATLVYERDRDGRTVAVWIEPGSSASAAGAPSASVPGPAAQVQGTVQAVTISGLTLKTADGRTVEVDLGRVDAATRDSIRPGDTVTVAGQSTGGDRVVAESVRRETVGRR